MGEQLTVILADRRPLMREAFRANFDKVSSLRLVAEVGTIEEAEAAVLRLRTGLLILQSDLLAGGQVETLYRLKSWCPDTAIIIMGISGITTGELAEVAYLGHRWLPDHATAEDMMAAVLDGGRDGARPHNGPADPPGGVPISAGEQPLTSRETEILRLAAAGLSNQQIADQLVISRYTVRNHIRNIFAKLKVKNRTAASAFIHATMFERALTSVTSPNHPAPSQTAKGSRLFPRLQHLLQKRSAQAG
jgi:two-component system response regulator DesR